MGAICLGPMGNAQGGHWFFSLTSESRVVCHHWTALPMPQEVILRVSQIGYAQGMPSCITYVNRRGDEISDRLEDFVENDDDDGSSSESDDDTYMENGSDQDSEDDGTTVSNDETTSSDDDDDDDSQGNPDPAADDETTGSNDETTSSDVDDDNNPQGNPHPPANETHDPAVRDPAGSLNPVGPEDHGDANRAVNMDITVVDGIEGSIGEGEEWEGECGNDASSNATCMGKPDGCKDEDECESDASSSVASSEFPSTESEQFEAAEAGGRDAASSQTPSTESELFEAAEAAGQAAASSHDDISLKSIHGERRLSTRKRIPAGDSELQYLVTVVLWDPTHRHDLEENMWGPSDYNFLTTQMSAKRGLRQFGQKGVDTLMKELQQLIDRWVMRPRDAKTLSWGEKKSALKYLMLLKEKRCRKVKGQGCADRRKQRLYKLKEETSSPTIRLESLFLSSMIDAKENQKVMVCDIPGAFMQADISTNSCFSSSTGTW